MGICVVIAIFLSLCTYAAGNHDTLIIDCPHNCELLGFKSSHKFLPKPTQGADGLRLFIWPMPQYIDYRYTFTSKEENTCVLDTSFTGIRFEMEDVSKTFPPLMIQERFCCRYMSPILERRGSCEQFEDRVLLVKLQRSCSDTSEGYYKLHYDLTKATIDLHACSRSGFHYGLETVSQLMPGILNGLEVLHVEDFPSYEWRGLMIDTSRHYIKVDDILRTLSAMSMNKLNKLHLHLTDSASFPLYLRIAPALFQGHAPDQKYTKKDMSLVVEYAQNLSIEVIPEIDMPQHTDSWKGVNGSLVPCSHIKPVDPNDADNYFKKIDLSVLDITRNETLNLVQDVLHELSSWFPSQFFHVGFDEVDFRCWDTDRNVLLWKHKNGFTNIEALRYFFDIVRKELLNMNKTLIVWQDALETMGSLPEETVIQTWKCWTRGLYGRLLGDITAEVATPKHKLIESTCFYLDHEHQWYNFYTKELTNGSLGGEACLWTELIDFTNIHCRIWPRTSAVAERLWASYPVDELPKTQERFNHFVKHLNYYENLNLDASKGIQDACPLLESQGIQRDPFIK